MVLAGWILVSSPGSLIPQGHQAARHARDTVGPSQSRGPVDRAELEVFLDGLFEKDMVERHIAGAAVSVVKDGDLFFARGYGYADIERGIHVDPERTGFRIGSVTKLFTWTAVMQLVEQGRLNLDQDINAYLDFRIPDTYPRPITLEHLLTHTAGFEDRFFEMLVLDADDSAPVGDWLVSHIPARVRPPGEYAAYSNYGTALAGYIVGRVSGKPYDRYVQDHILDPLGMRHTSARSPIPPDLRAHESKGYTYQDGAFEVFPDYQSQRAMGPGGAIIGSATDMARFMIAHLRRDGDRDTTIFGGRILDASTTTRMHRRSFAHDPRLLGTAHGFFEFSANGQRAIGHNGEAHPTNSLMLLLPDQGLGLFVAYNSEGGGDLTLQHLGFQRAFFDHYYPAPAVEPPRPPSDFPGRAGQFEGSYRLTRSSYTTLEKVATLFGGVTIGAAGDGTLVLSTPWFERRFVEVEPLYFRQVDGPYGIVFHEDDRGRITHMSTDFTPMFAFERMAWYETPRFTLALALACVLVFLSVIPVALTRAIRNRRPDDRGMVPARGAPTAYWVIAGVGVLNLLFAAGTMLWGNPRPLFGIPMTYRIVLGVGVSAALLTILATVLAVRAWANRYWGIAIRVHQTVVTVAGLGFIWLLQYWNLLGWRF